MPISKKGAIRQKVLTNGAKPDTFAKTDKDALKQVMLQDMQKAMEALDKMTFDLKRYNELNRMIARKVVLTEKENAELSKYNRYVKQADIVNNLKFGLERLA